MPKSVLVVDDDRLLLDMLRGLLSGAGYDVELASSIADAQRKVQRHPPSVAVVDVNLGEESGLDLVRLWRISQSFPVLVLSGLGTPMDRVVGLELGADDYLVKPFEPRELLLRLRILHERRRTAPAEEDSMSTWQLGTGQFDERRRCLRVDGEDIALSTAEFKLTSYLVRHANRAVSREQILEAVQHRDRHSSDRAVDVLIGRVRKKNGRQRCPDRAHPGPGLHALWRGEAGTAVNRCVQVCTGVSDRHDLLQNRCAAVAVRRDDAGSTIFLSP